MDDEKRKPEVTAENKAVTAAPENKAIASKRKPPASGEYARSTEDEHDGGRKAE